MVIFLLWNKTFRAAERSQQSSDLYWNAEYKYAFAPCFFFFFFPFFFGAHTLSIFQWCEESVYRQQEEGNPPILKSVFFYITVTCWLLCIHHNKVSDNNVSVFSGLDGKTLMRF